MALMKRELPTVIRSTLGHSVYFPGGDAEVFVPTILQGLALEAGATFVAKEEQAKFIESEDKKAEARGEQGPVEPGERATAILEGVRRIALANQSGDFTAAGIPKAPVVSKLLGYRVDVTEVRDAWETYTQEPFKEA